VDEMTTGSFVDKPCDGSSALERFQKAHVFRRSRDRQVLNLCPEYIALFNPQFRMIDFNGTALRAMANPEAPRRDMVNRPVVDYFPDLEPLGVYQNFLKVHSNGGSYTINEYQLNGFNLDNRIRCTVTVFKADGVTVVMGEDITVKSEYAQKLGEYAASLEHLQNERKALLTALDVLAKRQEEKALDVEHNCYSNIQSIVLPLLSQLKFTRLDTYQREVVGSLESGICSIADNFSRSLRALDQEMTPREIEIANLIRAGKATKEIAQLLHLASKTVDFHRRNMRRKMGIANTNGNLRSCLLHASDIQQP
jgi:DNA-binding CsgD family transcriptional regulator